MNCLFLFPNQLFETNKSFLANYNYIFLIEDTLFFNDKERITNFNKIKLLLHRVSMKFYYKELIKCNNTWRRAMR